MEGRGGRELEVEVEVVEDWGGGVEADRGRNIRYFVGSVLVG